MMEPISERRTTAGVPDYLQEVYNRIPSRTGHPQSWSASVKYFMGLDSKTYSVCKFTWRSHTTEFPLL
jgi:hypothetical protein